MAITNIKELLSRPIECQSPERELVVYPRWIVFYSDCNYKKPLYARFFIENREKFPVTYTIKTKQKLFKISEGQCGILQGGEKMSFKLYLSGADEWPLAVNDYVQKQLKICVESLRIPTNIKPESKLEMITMAKNIWKRSPAEWPMERMYTKINVALERTESLLMG